MGLATDRSISQGRVSFIKDLAAKETWQLESIIGVETMKKQTDKKNLNMGSRDIKKPQPK